MHKVERYRRPDVYKQYFLIFRVAGADKTGLALGSRGDLFKKNYGSRTDVEMTAPGSLSGVLWVHLLAARGLRATGEHVVKAG